MAVIVYDSYDSDSPVNNLNAQTWGWNTDPRSVPGVGTTQPRGSTGPDAIVSLLVPQVLVLLSHGRAQHAGSA